LDAEEIDGLEAREHAELFLGLGFVAFQTYALGTWTDLNRIRQAAGKRPVDKLVCYKTDPILVNQNGPTRIELINAVANYFKHHDEWPREWPEKRDTIITPTIITLKTVGITQKSEFPCIDAACMLCGDGWQLVFYIRLFENGERMCSRLLDEPDMRLCMVISTTRTELPRWGLNQAVLMAAGCERLFSVL
jgi:hypothetical protein